MDQIGRDYLTLALRLGRHVEGFIDAYFGPAEIKAGVEAEELRPLASLIDDAYRLQDVIERADYDAQRQDFLARQVQAMRAVTTNLSGDQSGFAQEVEQFFDITPEMVDEVTFEAAHAHISRLLPGSGSLFERMNAWKKQMELEAGKILPVFERALDETRRRSRALFGLPSGEDLALELVEDKPWSAYNWYLGGFRSRIDINTDLPLRATSAVPLLAHEAYPGHHTEHALKEHHLYRQGQRAEHGVQLLLAPECVLSEGIADSGLDIIFDDADLAAFLRDELYPLAGLAKADAERDVALMKARDALGAVGGNAALLLHRDQRSPQEVQQYLEYYGPVYTQRSSSHLEIYRERPLPLLYLYLLCGQAAPGALAAGRRGRTELPAPAGRAVYPNTGPPLGCRSDGRVSVIRPRCPGRESGRAGPSNPSSPRAVG
jgi:hypothetical protein